MNVVKADLRKAVKRDLKAKKILKRSSLFKQLRVFFLEYSMDCGLKDDIA